MKRLGVAAAIVDDVLVPGDIGVTDGVIDAVGLPGDGSGLAIPGMVDLQVNGYGGVDFLTADDGGWTDAARAMAREGVTAYVANLITSPEPLVTKALQAAERVVRSERPGGSHLLGAHLEGPFLEPTKAGTHPREHLRSPDLSLLERLLSAGPVVGVTLAPELPGGLDLVRVLAERGVLVSLGHSAASGAQAHAGFHAGARTVTHVFNAMTTPTSREPGLAGVALTRPDVFVQLICDGVHLSWETAALVIAAARSRFVLVTDALSAAGAPDGDYWLGEDVEVLMRDGRARNRDGGLAGSVLSLAGALRGAVDAGASVEDAVAATTTRPADLLGRIDLGRLRPGDPADIVVLDDALSVSETLLAGEPVD
jgi:N-acetylglucosamine-6-phosphate deacetylase